MDFLRGHVFWYFVSVGFSVLKFILTFMPAGSTWAWGLDVTLPCCQMPRCQTRSCPSSSQDLLSGPFGEQAVTQQTWAFPALTHPLHSSQRSEQDDCMSRQRLALQSGSLLYMLAACNGHEIWPWSG